MSERHLWLMIRRGFLLIAKAIEREPEPTPLLLEVRRGLLQICAAIARYYEIKTRETIN